MGRSGICSVLLLLLLMLLLELLFVRFRLSTVMGTGELVEEVIIGTSELSNVVMEGAKREDELLGAIRKSALLFLDDVLFIRKNDKLGTSDYLLSSSPRTFWRLAVTSSNLPSNDEKSRLETGDSKASIC